jgi:hypothetical protein
MYFYDAEYEEFFGYDVISTPMCLLKMREKVSEGAYDDSPYSLIKQDLELLVNNALQYNMPKDEPHYRAKILLIVGLKFLEHIQDLLECTEEFLVNENPQEIYQAKRSKFYLDLQINYLSYLLNFRLERTSIEVKTDPKRTLQLNQDASFFSSKILLANCFSNCEFRFRIKKKPHKIDNLFNIPRLSPSGWWPIRTRVCYFHPEEDNPIIFECPTCRESFCCTPVCILHHTCENCGVRGCSCDRYRCGCVPSKDKEKKSQ